MPRKSKQYNKQIRHHTVNLTYSCNKCNGAVITKYVVCPRCGEFHPDGKASNDWSPTKPPERISDLKTH